MKGEKEWFADDDFWNRYAPVIFDDKRWAEVPEVMDGIIRLAGMGLPVSSVHKFCALDLCCGIGRITAELSRRGFRTTGVDMCASYLETAREDASHENLDTEYIRADVRSFKRPGYYDLSLNLYVSFGYFKDRSEDLLMVRNVFESLKTGGSFIIETLGKEIAVRDFIRGEWFERAGYTVLTEYEPMDSWSGLKNRWILINNKDSGFIEKIFIQRLYAATELRALMMEAGFSVVELYGGWDESPYDQNALVLIAVGRKG